MRRRLSRSFERLLDLVPEGIELSEARLAVVDDLVDSGDLADLAGGGPEFGDAPLFDRARHELPRIRPVLVALAARASGSTESSGELQYASELLHLALVVHDVALGRGGGRRRRVARRVARRSADWLSANHLTLRAMELTRQAGPEVLSELVDTLRSFADAHAIAQDLQGGGFPRREDWLEHADAHTGALLAFCCRAGAARGDEAVRSTLGRYGRHLGRLWHIAEDVAPLELQDAGGHLFARALAGRPVLPVALAAEVAHPVGDAWDGLVRTPDIGAADAIAELLRAYGGVGRAREVMARESWAARRLLRTLPDTRYRTALDSLAAGLARVGLTK